MSTSKRRSKSQSNLKRYREERRKGEKYPGVDKSVKEHLAILEEGNSRSGRNMHVRCTK